ncbi:MAG: AbrB family transcriptional regulator [Thermoplasmata archaeon]|nr:MAG: AbrB family transcriptional regulator [Thermoplasmata archaeon]
MEVEIKKIDEQGRIIIPVDWRKREMGKERKVFIFKEKGCLKIIPLRKVDLTEFFDKVDFGMNIDEWERFEKKIYKIR